MSTFTWIPDQGMQKTIKSRVNASKFGDGYVQRSVDGINPLTETLALNFTVRTRLEINAIEAFLEAALGVSSFYYTAPGSTPKRYTCDTWQPTYMHDGDASLSCTFTRVYEP